MHDSNLIRYNLRILDIYFNEYKNYGFIYFYLIFWYVFTYLC